MASNPPECVASSRADVASAPVALASGAAPAGQGRLARRPLQIRPVVLLKAALVLLITANLGRIPVFSTGDREAPILFNDVCVAMVLAVGGLAMLQARSIRLDRVALAALTFAGIGALSAVLAVPRFGLASFELFVSLAYLARWVVYFGIYVVVINTVTARDAIGVWRAFEGGALVFAAFGVIQSIFLPGFAQLVYPDARLYLDWDPQGHRLVSTILDPNFAGMFVLIPLLVQIARIAMGVQVAGWKPLLLIVALVLTASRSSILAFLVGSLLILSVRGMTRRIAYGIGTLALLVLAGLPQLLTYARTYNKLYVDPSALARVTQWLRGLRVLSDHWLIGIGFNTWAYAAEWYGWERVAGASYGIDGGLLFITVMTGIVGLTCYLGMTALLVARCRATWRDTRRDPEHRALALGCVAATVAYFVHSLFTNSILLPYLMEPMWVLWGLTFVLWRTPGDEEPGWAPATRIQLRPSPR